MLGYDGQGGGGGDFAAQPRVVQPYRFKDPYGTAVQEYYPQNIMYDKRIQRGSTFAAMVIPAGTSPDTMVMDKSQAQTQPMMRAAKEKKRPVFIYPDRSIPTPEPLPGRCHMDVQTEEYFERLTDKPMASEQGVATEFYLDRPPVPLFQPRMPAKENCKATQIHDGDPELFDFDKEVEPMLNVLCERTLEQARMEVLEQNELAIIKAQQKEYEEVRNAELIEAQRFEAAELRQKQEILRRGVQQRARKAEKKSAHQKFVCRTMAKNKLSGLREGAMRHLADLALLQRPIQIEMLNDVLPWMIGETEKFLADKTGVDLISEEVMGEGIVTAADAHKVTLRKRQEALLQAERDAKKAAKEKELFRQNRRAQRIKREKDNKKQALRDEIYKYYVKKGETQQPVASTDLLDFHGNYVKAASFLGSLGGHLQQMYYVIATIMDKHEADLTAYYERSREDPVAAAKQAETPRELLIERFFMPFLLQYIKDLKCDKINILKQQPLVDLIETFKDKPKRGGRRKKKVEEEEENKEGPQEVDLSKLNNDQKMKLRYAFVEQRLFEETLQNNTNRKAMDLLLSCLFMIVTQSIPEEVLEKFQGDRTFKIDNIYQSVALVSIPDGVHTCDHTYKKKVKGPDDKMMEISVDATKNTNEKAVVRLRIPLREQTPSEYAADHPPVEKPDEEPGNEDAALAEAKANEADQKEPEAAKMVEEPQDDKALAIAGRGHPQTNYSVLVINQYAQRQHRQEFLNAVSKQCPDWFEGNNRMAQLAAGAESLCEKAEAEYIAKNCGEYEMPCFDFNINAADYE